MQTVTNLNVSILKVHPRNEEFFDNIEGDTYEQFKNSIKQDGVITPLIVSPDMTVISGHQRLKACLDLGINIVPVIIREELTDEDLKLRQLIASNFGRLKNDPAKMRRAISEYVELIGLPEDGRKKNDLRQLDGGLRLTREEIAKELGISIRDLQRLLKIEEELIPELKETLDKGFISKTAALSICSQISKTEQQELLTELTQLIGAKNQNITDDTKKKVSNNEVEKLMKQLQELREEKEKLKEMNTDLLTKEYEVSQLQEKIKQMEEFIYKNESNSQEIENLKSSYQNKMSEIEKLNQKIKNLETQKQQVKIEYVDKEIQVDNPLHLEKIKKLEKEYKETLHDLNEKNDTLNQILGTDTNWKLLSTTSETTLKMMQFIKEMAQYDYLAEAFNEIPDATRKEYVRSIYGVYKWARNILSVVRYDDVVGINKDIIEVNNINYKFKEEY